MNVSILFKQVFIAIPKKSVERGEMMEVSILFKQVFIAILKLPSRKKMG